MARAGPDVTQTVNKSKQIKNWIKERTILEKVLFVFLIITLLCLIGLAITLAVKDMQVGDEICVSPECLNSATEVLMWTDTNVDPCEDFYNYTCTMWMSDPAQSEKSSTRFSNLKDSMDLQLKALLEGKDKVPHHFQKARLYYNACMYTDERESLDSLDHFLSDLKSFGGYPALELHQENMDNVNYLDMIRHMHRNGAVPGILVNVDIELDIKNNSRQLITVSQTTLGLPDKSYFTRDHVVGEYLTMLIRQAIYLCKYKTGTCPTPTEEGIREALVQAVEVEMHLAKFSVSGDELSNKENIYNVMDIFDLQIRAPGIDWLKYIKIFFPHVDETETIMVHSPDFLEEFSKYIRHLDSTTNGKRNLANYLMYRHTLGASSHLTRYMASIQNDFRRVVFHQDDAPKHWVECVTYIRQAFDLSLASMYAQMHFQAEKKAALEGMVNHIREDLKAILKVAPWMDEHTREGALLKIDHMHIMAGYPDGILDVDELNKWYGDTKLRTAKNHYDNYKQTSAYLHSQPRDSYKKPLDHISWRYLPNGLFETNAIFDHKNNTIFIPLAAAQDWSFNENSPKYLNYARIGFVIAREMAQAFGTQGAEFDKHGNWRTWWSNTTPKSLDKSSKCMVDMFNSYYVPEAEQKISGTRTLAENMADELGVAAVYTAYTTASSNEPDAHLPGIDSSPNQLFWFNLASMWCEKHPDEFYKKMVKSSHHSPARYRINSMLSNSNDFAQDFECKVGSVMNKNSKKCHVWRTSN